MTLSVVAAYTPRHNLQFGGDAKKLSPAIFLIVAFAFVTLSGQKPLRDRQPTLTPQNSGTTNRLIAVSPVDAQTVWASGINGTFIVTTNGGKTWRAGVVKGAEALQFRDVQGVSDRVAYLLSIGNNASDFRMYKTEDGGATWTQQFQNKLTKAFYDCFAFWTPTRGIAHSDSVTGVFPDLRTPDGMTWESITNNMPPALPSEASFSSSGTCVATQADKNAWIATGGSTIARILATKDGGDTWNAYNTPLPSSPTAGGFTLAFRDASHGIMGGGNLNTPKANSAQVAASSDGGKTWTLTSRPPVTGAIFGLSYLKNTTGFQDQRLSGTAYSRTVVITANTGGAAWTPDEGSTWSSLPGISGYWGVAFANPQAGWMVGEKGTILKISFR